MVPPSPLLCYVYRRRYAERQRLRPLSIKGGINNAILLTHHNFNHKLSALLFYG